MSAKPTLYYLPSSPPARAVMLVAKAINLELDLKCVPLLIMFSMFILVKTSKLVVYVEHNKDCRLMMCCVCSMYALQ